MKTELAEQIEAAQRTFGAEVVAALNKFSEATGLSIESAAWKVERAMDAGGRTIQVAYWDVRSDLASGLS